MSHRDTELERKRRELIRQMLEREGLDGAADSLPRRRSAGPAPLSSAQRRVWFAGELDQSDTTNTLGLALEMLGEVDPGRLVDALHRCVRRHEILHTLYRRDEDGDPVQVPALADDGSPLVPEVEIEQVTAVAAVGRAQQIVRELGALPFDLNREIPVRARVLRSVGGQPVTVLILVVHHIAFDDSCWQILLADLDDTYRGAPVDELPRQYADYAEWQRSPESSIGRREQLAYWRDRLTPVPPRLGLAPTSRLRDRSGGGTASDDSTALVVTGSHACSAAVRRLAAELSTTPFVLLSGVYLLLLHRGSMQDDVAVAVPTVLRDRPETGRMIGNFGNTRILRTQLRPGDSARDFLTRVVAGAATDMENQQVPFEEVAGAVPGSRRGGRIPFTDGMFLHFDDLQEHTLGGVPIRSIPVHTGTAVFDTTFAVCVGPQELAMTLIARSAVHSEEGARGYLDTFVALLDSVLATPDLRVDLLDTVGPGGRAVRTGGAGATTGPAVPVRIADHWLAAPRAVAVTSGDGRKSVTYAALVDVAGHTARRLQHAGVRPGDAVVVLGETGPEFIAGLLGIWTAGAYYVPLDPEAPVARHDLILGVAKPVALLVTGDFEDSSVAARCLSDDIPVVRVATPDGVGAATPPMAPYTPAPDALAYVIFTSGSTGVPKGVEVPHSALAALLDSADRVYGFAPDDVWSQLHSPAFDYSVWEIWGPLSTGGRVVTLSRDTARDPGRLMEAIAVHGVTRLSLTPAAFAALERRLDRWPGEKLPLRSVTLGGEAMPVDLTERWVTHPLTQHCRVINMYGITETTVHVSSFEVTAESIAGTGAGSPIGSALDHLEMTVRDEQLRLCGLGVVGEICVSGSGLARGYLGDPELTAGRFVHDPAGTRVYRTGDLGRLLPDGIDYLGRADDQISVRGHRVELGEIERALCACPGVRDAAAAARTRDEDGVPQTSPVAVVVLDAEDCAPDVKDRIRQSLATMLPGHAVPAALVVAGEVPLTVNGKIDRAAVVEACVDDGRARVAVADPAGFSPVERRVVQVWAQVLDAPPSGPDTNFFDLGGHSLLLIGVQERLAREHGVAIDVVDLYEHPTVAQLATFIERTRATVDEEAVSAATSASPSRGDRVRATRAARSARSSRRMVDPA